MKVLMRSFEEKPYVWKEATRSEDGGYIVEQGNPYDVINHPKQQRTIEALGLRKIGSETVKPDNAQTRGMIFVVKHLVSVESVKEN